MLMRILLRREQQSASFLRRRHNSLRSPKRSIYVVKSLTQLFPSYDDDFLRSNHGNPEMQADVASTHLYVGRLKAQLGDFRDALSSSRQSGNNAQNSSAGCCAGALVFERILASVRFEQGWAQLQLRDVENGGQCSLYNAVHMRNKIVDEFAQDSDRLDLARDYHNLAIALDRSGDSEQAAEAGEKVAGNNKGVA